MRSVVLGVSCLLLGGCSFINDFGGYTFDGDGGPDAAGDGGGDDGGEEGGLDTTPPSVVSTTPGSGGHLLDGRVPIRVTFDGPVVAATSAVTVLRDTVENVAGTLTTDGSALVFTPTSPLAQYGVYQVTVSGAVTDVAGNALGAPYVFSFDVPQAGSGDTPAVRLDDTGTGDASCPQLAMDANGNAVVVFAKGPSIYTSYYRAGVGFSPTTKLADGKQATVAMSPGGRIAIIYTGVVSGADRVIVRVSGLADPTFGSAELADTASTRLVSSVAACDVGHHGKNIAVNDAGHVIAAWRGYRLVGGEPQPGVVRNVRTPAGVWGTFIDYGTNPNVGSETDRLGIAVDAAGNAQAVLAYEGIGPAYVSWKYAIATSSWLADAALTPAGGSVTAPRLEISPAGNYVLARSTYMTNPKVLITTQSFMGSTTQSALDTIVGVNASQLHLAVRHGLWAIWVNTSGIGLARRATGDSDWVQGLVAAASAPSASFPMIAGRGASREAVLVWQSAGTVRWTGIVVDGLGTPSASTIYALPTDGTAATSPNVVYDATSGHGLVTWLEAHPTGVEAHATQFHNLPPGE